MQEALQVRLQEADLRLPSKPPAKTTVVGAGGTNGGAGTRMNVNVVNHQQYGRE